MTTPEEACREALKLLRERILCRKDSRYDNQFIELIDILLAPAALASRPTNEGLIAAMEGLKYKPEDGMDAEMEASNAAISDCIALARTHGVEPVSLEDMTHIANKAFEAVQPKTMDYSMDAVEAAVKAVLDSIGVPYAE